MKRLFTVTLLFFNLLQGYGQENSWVEFGKDYYKIPTTVEGVYKLSYTTLSASGMNVSEIDPRELRLFHRGEEVSMYIAGEEDGSFDANDHVEFIGKKNDAMLDRGLYGNPDHLPNPYFNTHNDTTAFFLTVSPGTRGKRMNFKTLSEGEYPMVQTVVKQHIASYAEQYSLGQTYFPNVRLSLYDQGQGWTSQPITRGNNRTFEFNDLGAITTIPNPTIEIGLLGRSDSPHRTSVQVGANTNSLREIGQYDYIGFENYTITLELTPSDFASDGDLAVRIGSLGRDGGLDNISVSYIKIDYGTQVPDFNFTKTLLGINQDEPAHLALPANNQNYLAYDISRFPEVIKHQTEIENGTLKLEVGGTNSNANLLIQRSNTTIEPNVLQKVRFRNLLNQPADYLIISHPRLRTPSSNYGDPVTAFAAHRASPLGGAFDTLTVNINEIYDQFAFGEKTPLAIREFLKQYSNRHQPEYLLLVGRGFGIYNTRRLSGVNHFYRNNPSIFDFQELIPAFGYPYSDNRYAVGLDPNEPHSQDIAVGRIPARTSQEVANYLEKVKEKDGMGVQEPWQKNLIHLSGGRSAFELERFYNFLNGFKAVAEDIYLGGKVSTIRKRSNATVELINIADEINEGASMVTFFGHAAPATTDIDIGFASVNEMGYRNQGKYPVLLLNGCDAGNAFGAAYTFGEDWIVTPNRGASIFLAHADIGIDVYLRRFSESFYAKAFADSSLIHQSIGKVKIESDRLFLERFGPSEVNQSHINQMIMLGDPAVRMFPADRADYAIRGEEITLQSFDDTPLNALMDSMQLSMVIRNIGKVDLDSMDLNVSRQLPDGSIITYDTERMAPIFRKDTITFTIPNSGINAFGDNVFTVELNKRKHIRELTYANNLASATLYVPMSGTLNLKPYDFAIVNVRETELIAQIPGRSIEERNLVLQLDTAADFSSAYRRETRVTTANLARWKVDLFQGLGPKDSLTFYWRSRFLEPREGENRDWSTSSFSYINNGPEGWTQRSMPQLQSTQLNNLEIDPQSQSWRYRETALNIDVFTFGPDNEDYSAENVQVMLNGVSYILDTEGRFCPNGTLGLLAFDQRKLEPYLPVPLTNIDVLDPKSCGRSPQIIQNIRNQWITNEGQTMLLDYINNVKEGDYVIIFSVGQVTFSDWPEEVIFKMKELGANEATLRNLRTGEPYILFGQKGMEPGDAIEVLAKTEQEIDPNAQVIRFETDINGYFPNGSIISPRVGPASSWVRFFNHVVQNDVFNTEYSGFDLMGVTMDGGEVLLYPNIKEPDVDLSAISSEEYPYMRLRFNLDDSEAPTPEQLKRWQVNYSGVPEGVLTLKSKKENVQLFEGQESVADFEFINIGYYDFPDSVTVEWTFTNLDQRRVERFSKKIAPVEAGERVELSIPFDSRGRAGKNSLNVFANPRIMMEQRFRNNVIDLPEYFQVARDELNPILDVSFDGIYIMDGDIVSPTVLISALVKDENRYSLKKDTVGMELMLKRDCEGCDFEKISFSNPKVKWFEATENSDFRIELQPGPLEDGMYTLRVNASDASGNKAGEKPYEVNFEVINESQITNFYPYPNPFSTSVRFVFTVTGAQAPDEIKIQIMTVTGKVVREIFQDELGPIRIGNNITEYAWDGKDEFGDQLANGVYIYRVLVRKEGQFMEHRATAGDKAFKKGYGKMYLLR
ncbi:putative type IX secretion system sortase PorU2 [Pleomorphovibrio marinus]|uniref:putative type IX secretion system sortase PorU2 n=1 Tax=Pleomorphovibrio marinus TaxID=2164132 RepID=UPI000E0C7B75|nr:C25 family cysteine peptidase [Pleomorphovibrio marinus]